jgi:hypothetical protein
MNDDQKGGLPELVESVKMMPDELEFVKPDNTYPEIISPTLMETYPREIHAMKIDANHVKIDDHEFLIVHDKPITTAINSRRVIRMG